MKKLLLAALLLAGCAGGNDHRSYLLRHDYLPLRHLYAAPQPTVGPALCSTWYTGDVYAAHRFPVPEEHCFTAMEVHVLVCCSYSGSCKHRELNAFCIKESFLSH